MRVPAFRWPVTKVEITRNVFRGDRSINVEHAPAIRSSASAATNTLYLFRWPVGFLVRRKLSAARRVYAGLIESTYYTSKAAGLRNNQEFARGQVPAEREKSIESNYVWGRPLVAT
jgi:hypothetical protein